MNKIAIDIALIPSQEMMDIALEINEEFISNHDPLIVLDEQKCVPHISLCMGVIKEESIEDLYGSLLQITTQQEIPQLRAEGISSHTLKNGKIFSGIDIEKTDELSSLQQGIMEKAWPHLTYTVNTQMFSAPPKIDDVILGIVRDYKKQHGNPALFHPHLTIGHGETEEFEHYFPMPFTADRIAIYQLGNYCTCRKELASIKLTNNL